ncbi:MAG: efflux RND transporter periplasmic adaptor subunit, partial [Candidatus Tectomicrobia bacterium]
MEDKPYKEKLFERLYGSRFQHATASQSSDGRGTSGKLWRWGLVGFLVIASLGVITAVVGRHLMRTSPAVAQKFDRPLPVRVVEAKQVVLTDVLGANGVVEPIAIVNLTAKMTAPVEKIVEKIAVEHVAVDVGDTVVTGQTLIQFNHEVPELVLRTAQSATARAANDLKRAESHFQHVKSIYEQGLSNAVLRTVHSSMQRAAGDLKRAQSHLQR